MNPAAVELTGVTKRFGSQIAVDRLDLTVPKQSIYGFIGPNGSGKTTAMRMILRIIEADEGQVQVLGESAGRATNDRIGYLPEERGLYRRMTVQRALSYFARLKGVREHKEVVSQWLDRVGASDWANKKIEQLSKGMAQKIQFIAAVVAQPELIILDEPFSGLDPVNLDLLRSIVVELREAGSTIIFSTHDMDVAEKLCDRVFMIFRGKKVLDGPIDEVQSIHGSERLRVKLANTNELSASLDGVERQFQNGRFIDIELAPNASTNQVLAQLLELGDVEHFESVRPSLHDIFVSIAGPDAAESNTASSMEVDTP